MGLTSVKMTIRKFKGSDQFVAEEFLVDSGAVYSVAPTAALARLGVEADQEQSFTLANGERMSRKVGDAYFQLGDKGGYSKVVFGEEGDMNLLGALPLEACGLVLDPLKRELKPMPMLLA